MLYKLLFVDVMGLNRIEYCGHRFRNRHWKDVEDVEATALIGVTTSDKSRER